MKAKFIVHDSWGTGFNMSPGDVIDIVYDNTTSPLRDIIGLDTTYYLCFFHEGKELWVIPEDLNYE